MTENNNYIFHWYPVEMINLHWLSPILSFVSTETGEYNL